MTPHVSGTSLSAQARYAAGVREILECWFEGRPIREEYLIVDKGRLAGAGAHSYSEGDTTGRSDGSLILLLWHPRKLNIWPRSSPKAPSQCSSRTWSAPRS
jgi:hypothetical protein